jgi:FlaA1/EpsC-like NDP-sugar epimerase
VPEVGEQTRIADLAAFLIGTAEVPIVFTGCRPGDKLTEELVSKSETCRLQPVELEEVMQRLGDSIASRDVPALIRTLCSVVPEYVPSVLLR